MQNIARQMERLEEYQQIITALEAGKSPVLVSGPASVHKAQIIHAMSARNGGMVITRDEQSAARLCEELSMLEGAPIAWQYPERELEFHEMESISLEYEHMRLSVLSRIQSGEKGIVVASASAAMQLTIPPEILGKTIREIHQGEELPLPEILNYLVWAGYRRADQVEGLCQFAVRGGILDFFPPDAPQPIRVEYFDDEIDSISAFSIETQRREEPMDSVKITPARELLYQPADLLASLTAHLEGLTAHQKSIAEKELQKAIDALFEGRELPAPDRYLNLIYPRKCCLLDYIGERNLFLCEGTDIKETLRAAELAEKEDVEKLLEEGILSRGVATFRKSYSVLEAQFTESPTVLLDQFSHSYPGLRLGALIDLTANQLPVWSGDLNALEEDLRHYLGGNYCCLVLSGTERGAFALADDMEKRGLPAHYTADAGLFQRGQIYFCPGGLSAGVEYPHLGLVILSYGRGARLVTAKKRKKHKDSGKAIHDIADLSVGDYVVHYSHGIGIFHGVVKKEIQGVVKDYLEIQYAGTDRLFVPVTQLDMLTRYVGGKDGREMKLSRLNSGEWAKTRQRVKKEVQEMAQELIQLYAKRLQTPGFAFSEDTEWQKDFEQKFEYDETDDQLRCISEIKGDMERAVPMDRLLCGDVGFGKTEVALRAVFKCVMSGKQCAVMVPTTILAWQHYQTFLRRLDGFPIKVELLSRFRTPREQKDILTELRRGSIDVVIGTNKLVQKDVEFKDLGLCVIDEEQRFGVAQKERFKELRASVDVLTLSATPIPRTLNMAMSGIRDMSVIQEAPQDRRPVQTYVVEFDEGLIFEAIRRELRRGGQVFYLHNRVESISSCAAKLKQAIPEAKIGIGHGKMSEDELSDVWKRLIEREIDILVCTTIIETGVDVPNCNTLIIEDADYMGLAQLYQLRGRVGRSSRRAYAYFTFRKGRMLTETGEKRLAAIREFTSFGSGFRIAMRDLEIRGAGNILGTSQHGQMEAVGYDLYLRMLSEAISEERGEELPAVQDCQIDLPIGAHIPEEYIENLSQRVDIYRKIACVATQDDYLDVMDELIDRFGEPPAAVKGLLDVALIRNTAARLGISRISQQQNNVLIFPETYQKERIMKLVRSLPGKITVNACAKPYLAVRVSRAQDTVHAIREVLGILDESPEQGEPSVDSPKK